MAEARGCLFDTLTTHLLLNIWIEENFLGANTRRLI